MHGKTYKNEAYRGCAKRMEELMKSTIGKTREYVQGLIKYEKMPVKF